MATRFVRWAQEHPILTGVLIVIFYMGVVSQGHILRSFAIATAVMAAIVAFLIWLMKQEQRE